MLILGHDRLSKGKHCPAGLRKGLGWDPAGLKFTTVARNRKNTLITFNNFRSSISLGSTLDPLFIILERILTLNL